jgi:hypothetical protein
MPSTDLTQDDLEKLQLARSVYHVVRSSVESFEADDMVGPDLAYLLGTIIGREQRVCSWPSDRTIVQILCDNFSDLHPIWQFVVIEDD